MEDTITTRLNEANNIIEQTRDVDAAYAAGAIDFDTFVVEKAKRIASLKVAAMCRAGEEVSDDEYLDLIAQAELEAAKPSQEEINAADIAYLLMIGGEE